MILPFSTHFKDGTKTNFIDKIWASLLASGQVDAVDLLHFDLKCRENAKFLPTSKPYALSFSPKPHTIREDAHDRWHAGRLIHPVVFNRSKNQFQFAPTLVCKSVQKIEIKHRWDYGKIQEVFIDGYLFASIEPSLHRNEQKLNQMAKNDGFSSFEDFFAWFDHDFTGKIIHWTDLKY